MTRAARPADYSPFPKICRSTALLRSDYIGGPAITVQNQFDAIFSVPFLSTGLLDIASLDLHIGASFGRVTRLWDQANSVHGDATIAGAPKITTTLALGLHRWLIYEGGGVSSGSPPPGVYSFDDDNITPFGITAQDYCFMAVVQPTGAAHCNQSGAPGLDRGCLLNLNNAGLDALQIINNGVGDGVTGGRWTVSDGGAFTFTPTDSVVETSPIVLTVISSARGIEIYQNEEILASGTRSALVRTADETHLGKFVGSTPGATSGAFEGRVLAEMLWPTLSSRDAGSRRAMLYELFGIDFRRSRPKSKTLVFVGDSNMAGYKTVGRNGWEKILQASLPDVRCHNFGVEGSTILQNPAGGAAYANTTGLMDHSVSRALARAQGDVGLVISSIGNDFGLSPQPSATDLFNGHMAVATKARAANPNVKIFITTGAEHTGSGYTTLQSATNTQVRDNAVAQNYTVIDLAADAQLGQTPHPNTWFIDNAHMSDAGHARAAFVAVPVIKSKMGWV